MTSRAVLAALSLLLAVAQALHVEPLGARPALRRAGAAPAWGVQGELRSGGVERLRGGAPKMKPVAGKAKVRSGRLVARRSGFLTA
ncbi:hypothetical protein T484DRAFT_2338201 [Baffinella frigidus]|nr:hypothetical protein T484DRAFT_2338201 [Cryptophyta sp. CCMP2293]